MYFYGLNGTGYITLSRRPKNINPSGGRSIFAGCLFFEIGSSSADFFDLEQCRKPSSGHMTIAAGRLFGCRPIFLPNGQNFRPMPPAAIVRPSSSDRRGSGRSPPDENESPNHRLFTVGWPAGDRLGPYRCSFGSICN